VGCNAARTSRYIPTFRRNTLPLSADLKIEAACSSAAGLNEPHSQQVERDSGGAVGSKQH
jgi:hypothetical protein